MTAYGSIRVSSDRQAQSGLGLAAQRRLIMDYAKRHRLGVPIIVADNAVSASKKMFRQREGGGKIDTGMTEGDHVIIAKLDRAFRNIRDFANTIDDWTRRGIRVHILDIGVDTSTPVGKLIAGVMAAVAEWESRRIGERIRDAREILRAAGRSVNGRWMYGYRLRRGKLIADPGQRKLIMRIVQLRRGGLLWRQIAAKLATGKARTQEGRPWSKQACWRAYHRAIDMGWTKGQKRGQAKKRRRAA